MATRDARLELPAAGSEPAVVEVVHRPGRKRATRAALVLGLTLLLAPAVLLIPPHLLWPALVLAAGLYRARREWAGEYFVESFEGACPRCGEPLKLKPGSRIRGRQRLECYGCHREPELVLGGDDE